MPDVISGLADNPTPLLEQAFGEVAVGGMHNLPFFQQNIPVRACGFQLFERQWVGTMLTPWMLSLLILPGPDQEWEHREVGTKLALALPCGNVSFIVSEIAGCGQYLARSLMSPLDDQINAEQMLILAEQSARMALSLPVVDSRNPLNPGRRALLRLSRENERHA